MVTPDEHESDIKPPVTRMGVIGWVRGNLFNGFFRDFDISPFGRHWDEPWESRMPALDFKESDKEYSVCADLPGWDENDIDVSVSGDLLTIRGERSSDSEEGEEGSNGYRRTRRYGSFQRSIRLPDGVDRDNISATCERGVLTVTLPKTEEAQKQVRKIEVKSS